MSQTNCETQVTHRGFVLLRGQHCTDLCPGYKSVLLILVWTTSSRTETIRLFNPYITQCFHHGDISASATDRRQPGMVLRDPPRWWSVDRAYVHVACVRDPRIDFALAATGYANVVYYFAIPCARHHHGLGTPKTEMSFYPWNRNAEVNALYRDKRREIRSGASRTVMVLAKDRLDVTWTDQCTAART